MFEHATRMARGLFRDDLAAGAAGTGPSRFYILDALRSFAALAVLFWHYQNFFRHVGPGPVDLPVLSQVEPLYQIFGVLYSMGKDAVQFFWVVSGFVFATVYCGQSSTTREFFVNRFARLYPLHFLTLIIVALLQFDALRRLGVYIFWESNDLYHFVLQLFLASGWGLERDYSFNAPIWSVSAEIVIYAVFWLLHRPLLRFGILFPALISGICFAAFPFLGKNMIIACGAFFFVGVTFYALYLALRETPGILLGFALACIAVGAAGYASGNVILERTIGMTGLFGGVLLLCARLEGPLSYRWRHQLTWIGDNTYGMYLWHIPFQMVLVLVLGEAVNRLALSPWFLLFFIVSVAVIARFGFVLYERPMRDWIRGFARPFRAPEARISAP